MIDKTLLKSGDILLFHNNGFDIFGMAIRQLTGSFWNHVGMYVDGNIIEALGSGVVKTPIENYLDEKQKIIKVVRLKPEAFADINEYNFGVIVAENKIVSKIGDKYDWWAVAWLGIQYTFLGFMKKFRDNPFNSRKRFFCSELVCQVCYNISSINPYLFQGVTKSFCDTTTPRDISKSLNVFFIQGKDVN